MAEMAVRRRQGRDRRRSRARQEPRAARRLRAGAWIAWTGASTPAATWASTLRDVAVLGRLHEARQPHAPGARARHRGPGRPGRVRVDPAPPRAAGPRARSAARRGAGPGRRWAAGWPGCLAEAGARLTVARRRRRRASSARRPSWAPASCRPERDLRRGGRRLLAQRGRRHPRRRHHPAPALPRRWSAPPTSSSLEPRHGDALHARGILYAPDYVVNAGGLLSLLFETGETDEDGVVARVRGIGPASAALWERARDGGRAAAPGGGPHGRGAAGRAAARGEAR